MQIDVNVFFCSSNGSGDIREKRKQIQPDFLYSFSSKWNIQSPLYLYREPETVFVHCTSNVRTWKWAIMATRWLSFFRRCARLRSRTHDFHYSIQTRCDMILLTKFMSLTLVLWTNYWCPSGYIKCQNLIWKESLKGRCIKKTYFVS